MASLSAPCVRPGRLQLAPKVLPGAACRFWHQPHFVRSLSRRSGVNCGGSGRTRVPIERPRWYSTDRPSGPGDPAGVSESTPTQTQTRTPAQKTESNNEVHRRLDEELKKRSDISDRLAALQLGDRASKGEERSEAGPVSPPAPDARIAGEAGQDGAKGSVPGSDRDVPTEPAPPSETKSTTTRPLRSFAAGPLPSEIERLRWALSKKVSAWMESLQVKAAIWSQRVNKYTGTDYSAISALREDIRATERLVKRQIVAVGAAKAALDEAHARQASSQKEVVGLLERKHSWSATDLERYMALIRSEHVNEQAIQTAKDRLSEAETGLDETRIGLEKKERLQYHEEQVWSDTIRRNSTWVTIGLMGLNVVLLLSNVLAIEPWRRRRLVREIQATLEDNLGQTLATIRAVEPVPVESVPVAAAESALAAEAAETAAETAVESAPAAVEYVSESVPAAAEYAAESASEFVLAAGPSNDGPAAVLFDDGYVPALLRDVPPAPAWMHHHLDRRLVDWAERAIQCAYWTADHFFGRDRVRPVRPVDETVLFVSGAASAVGVGIVVVCVAAMFGRS